MLPVMRRNPAPFAIAVALLLWTAALAGPVRGGAEYDYDPSADFGKYHTFRWLGDGPDGAPRRQRQDAHPKVSPLVEKQIGEAVKTTLEAKGLEFVEQGPVDLVVAFHTGKQRDVVGYGWGPRYRGPRRVVVYEEGTLTLDLVDRAARELVWRGSIAATIKEDPEKLHQQIEKLVEKILKNYPPKTK
jgi:uncharacterized protein DUF4136